MDFLSKPESDEIYSLKKIPTTVDYCVNEERKMERNFSKPFPSSRTIIFLTHFAICRRFITLFALRLSFWQFIFSPWLLIFDADAPLENAV